MPRKSIGHPLLKFFQRAITFRRIAQVMHESHVARRVTPFQRGAEVVCVNRSLTLNGKVKLREFQENIANRAQRRLLVRAARQASGHVFGASRCAYHFVGLKSQFSSDHETVVVSLVMCRIERIA